MHSKRFFQLLRRYRWWVVAVGVLLLVGGYVMDSRPDPYTDARLAMRRAAAVMALQEAEAMPGSDAEPRGETRARGNPAGSSYLPYWAVENGTDAAGDGLQTATRGQGKGNRSDYDSPTTDSAPLNPSAARTGGRGNGGGDDLEHGRRVRPVGEGVTR